MALFERVCPILWDNMDDAFLELRFRDLHFFTRLAALGSLTATARELALPKATASRRLAQLEEHLGAAVVKRTTRSLSLTPRGEALVPRAKEMLALAEATRLELRSELPTGILRVSVPVPLGRMLAGQVIARFRQRLPSVALEIRLENQRVDLIAGGIDLAIRGGRLSDSELISRKLTTASLLRYCNTSYQDVPDGEIPLILAPGDTDLLRRAGLPHEPAAVVVDDRTAVADALVWGAGIGLLPTFLGEPSRAEGVLVRRDASPVAELPVHALYHASQREDLRLQVLIDELEKALRSVI